MSNLGNLYFDIALRDMTDADIDKIKKKLEKVGVKMGVDVDRKTFEANIKEALKKKTFKVNIEASKNIKKAAIEANKNVLGRSVSDFLKDNTFKANVDLVVRKASVQQAIKEAFAQAGLKYDTTASDARQNLIDTRTAKTNAYVEAQRALTELRKAQAASAHAANQQADAMERVNKTGERQKGVMATIREQVANAYAIYRVGRFLEGVIRISGEFQQQHVALQTILGDAQKADVLFSRIKGLAVESPFKFGELTGYAKQLAAFSIPYEEMFDTLKRFGDLSAGLGVDMGRIILAYGQVRSAEFLKGTELRQFTEAGIPLVAELAKRYTELEGTLVSVGDVYDRISKKQVAFSDVKAVLWDLTSEGGRFFNMQAELTDTLKGKLDKLIDSYEIFLADLGKSNSDVLGWTLDTLTEILGHWREVGNAILGITVAYGSYKAAVLAVAAAQRVTLALETIQGIVNLTRAMQGLTAATKAQAVAQGVLNAITSANPFVLAATILGSIAGLFIAFREETESEADAIARLRANMEDTNRAISEQEEEATKLISIMKDEKRTIDDRNRAYDGLMEMYGLLFPNMTREQVLMLDEVKIRKKVADAAKNEAKEKARLAMVEAQSNLNKAQSKYNEAVRQWEENPRNRIKGRTKDTPAINAAKAELDKQRNIYNSAAKYYEDLLKKEEVADNARKARWHKESTAIAESTGFFALAPDDKEVDVWEYFDRIKQGMDDIKRKKKLLNPESDNYSTMLGNLDDELKAYEKIYYGVLGGKNEEAIKAAEEARKERERRAKEEAKQSKKLGEEAAKAYLEALKNEVSRTNEKWSLFKELADATGDKDLAMKIAFDGKAVAFESELEWLKHRIQEEAKKANLNMSVTDLLGLGEKQLIDKGIEEKVAKGIGHLIETYNKSNKKLSVDTVKEFAEIIKASRNFEEQIAAIDAKLQEDLANLRVVYKDNPTALNFAEAEAKKRAEEEKSKVRFEQFKEDSNWVKIFDDLDRVSANTIYGMIDRIEEFAKSTNLSQDEVKQLMDALGKLRDKTFDFNPFGSLADAIKRVNELRNMTKRTNAYGVTLYDRGDGYGANRYMTEEEYGNALQSAESDIVKSINGISNKFDDLKNVLDPLVDLFGGADTVFGKIIGGLSNALGGASNMSNSFSSLMGLQIGSRETAKSLGSILGISNASLWGAAAGAAISVATTLMDAFGADYSSYNKMKEEYDTLLGVWDSLIERKQKYIDIDYADEGRKVGKEALDILNKQIEAYRTLGKERLNAGASIGSHSIGYRIKDDMSEEGWKQYNEAMKSMGLDADWVAKDRMELLFEMSAEQLAQLQEKAPVFWAKLDEDVREYLNNIIESNEALEEMRKTLNETLTGTSLDSFYDNYISMLQDLDSSNLEFAQSFEEYLKNAIVANVIGNKYKDSITKLYKDWAAYSDSNKDNVFDLTPEESDALKKAQESLTEQLIAEREALKEAFGWTDSNSASSGLSKGIQSVSEDTADLLASYVNGMRADLSVNRSLIEQLVNVSVPRMSMLAEAQLQQLQQVAANTKRNADAADKIYDLVNRVVDKGSNKLKV